MSEQHPQLRALLIGQRRKGVDDAVDMSLIVLGHGNLFQRQGLEEVRGCTNLTTQEKGNGTLRGPGRVRPANKQLTASGVPSDGWRAVCRTAE